MHKEAYLSAKRSENDLEDKLKALQQKFDNNEVSHKNEIMALKVRRFHCRYSGHIIVFRGLSGA